MKSILLIGVNYRSYDALEMFLESIDHAASSVQEALNVDVAIADNTETEQRQTISRVFSHIRSLTIYPSEKNVGYLGGALPIYNQLAQTYDLVSISNVDLQLHSNFLAEVLKVDEEHAAWLAPDIYTSKILRHENPYMLQRPSRKNFLLWNIVYSSTLLYRIYRRLYELKSKHHRFSQQPCCIYAGHGSFMLFTKAFVFRYPALQFPSYMYGEEIWLAELIRSANMHVLYIPDLKIENTGNVNTDQLRLKEKLNWSKTSLNIIKKHFFRARGETEMHGLTAQ